MRNTEDETMFDQYLSPGLTLWMAVGGLACLFGCSEPESVPCEEHDDCFEHEVCVEGTCQDDGGNQNAFDVGEEDPDAGQNSSETVNDENGPEDVGTETGGDTGVDSGPEEWRECVGDPDECPEIDHGDSVEVSEPYSIADGEVLGCDEGHGNFEPSEYSADQTFSLCREETHYYSLDLYTCDFENIRVVIEFETDTVCPAFYLELSARVVDAGINCDEGDGLNWMECDWKEGTEGYIEVGLLQLSGDGPTTIDFEIEDLGIEDIVLDYSLDVRVEEM